MKKRINKGNNVKRVSTSKNKDTLRKITTKRKLKLNKFKETKKKRTLKVMGKKRV